MVTQTVTRENVQFAEPWSITEDHNGYEKIFVPRENGAVFTKNTKYDRHFVSFKSRRGAEQFLIKHGAKVAEQAPEPILIRGPRELRWNRVTREYELVEVTPEMVERSRRRGAYVQEFDPCGVA